MGVTREYFGLQEEYQKKYGNRAVVLMQIGSFYEIYEYDSEMDPDAKSTKRIGHAVEISYILNMILTSKDSKRPHSMDNPYLVGFPCIAYERHRQVLLEHNYIIVRFDQEKTGKISKHAKIDRNVAEIVSPGTDLDIGNPINGTNQIICVYLEYQKRIGRRLEDHLIIAGLACLDVSTGKNIVAETYSKEDDPVKSVHEVYRFLTAQQPREILIHLNKFPDDNYVSYVKEILELEKYPLVIIKSNEIPSDFLKPNYQKQFLEKIFHNQGRINLSDCGHMKNNQNMNISVGRNQDLSKQARELVGTLKGPSLKIVSSERESIIRSYSILEELNLERLSYATIAYLAILQYAYEHNENIIHKLQNPETTWIDCEKHLILTHNAISQLNLLPDPHIKTKGVVDSLFSIINGTHTLLGKRYLRCMLLNPITNIEELEMSYNRISELMENSDLLQQIENILNKIPDLERYQRKLALGLIKPKELASLFRGYLHITKLHVLLGSLSGSHLRNLLLSEKDILEFNECMTYTLSRVDLDLLEQCTLCETKMEFEKSFLREGVDPTADSYVNTVKNIESTLEKICGALNECLQGSRGKMIELTTPKRKRSDDDDTATGVGLYTTSHKAGVLKMCLAKIPPICGQLSFTTIKKETVMITSEVIGPLCMELETAQTELEKYLWTTYMNIVNTIGQKYNFFGSINRLIGLLDFTASNARMSLKYKYFRPTLVKSDTSFLEIEDLRHPIIERLISTEYIPNSVKLGERPYGILLYGSNSSGKSSLTKSIGLNIILAQAGMFTAGKLKYSPYHQIITRLSGNDDIFKGHSSFVVEMMELRTILRNADCKTLVLGDELTRGSESTSGSALSVATFQSLAERKASFIFSTHLHNLPYIDEIVCLTNTNALRICHLSTHYDEVLQTLIYDRKLKEGSGSSIYGIEVAKYLGIDRNFLEHANAIRRRIAQIQDIVLNTKKSRYNSDVYVDSCSLCHQKFNLQTHHIKEQHEADDQGFIGHFHKNANFNLLVLCQKCHQELHANHLKIESKQILNGSILTVTSDK